MSRRNPEELFSLFERLLVSAGQPALVIALVTGYSILSRLAQKFTLLRSSAPVKGPLDAEK